MYTLAEKALAAKILVTGFVTGAFDRVRSDERGQGSIEYLGVVIVVVIILGIVITAATPIGETISQTIQTKVDEIANN